MFDGIEHTGIASPEPERLAQWYVDTLGFAINYRSESSRTCFVKAPNGSMIEIILAEAPGGPYRMKDPGLRHLALAVKDFDAALAALQAKGVQFLTEPSASKGNRVVFFADPDGNILHLIHREKPLP
jgi:glyoxylase I family protein